MDRRDIHELLNDPELLARYVRQSGYTPDPVEAGHQPAMPGGEWITQAQPMRAAPVPASPVPTEQRGPMVEVRFEISGQAWFEPGAFYGQSWETIREKVRQVLYERAEGWWLPMVNSDITRLWSVDEQPAVQPAPLRQEMAPPPTAALERQLSGLEESYEALLREYRAMHGTVLDLARRLEAVDRVGSMLREAQEGPPVTTPSNGTPRRRRKKPGVGLIDEDRSFGEEATNDLPAEKIETAATQ